MKRTAGSSMLFDGVFVSSYACTGGITEGEGPLGGRFDEIFPEDMAGEKTWESAESRILHEAVKLCISKSGRSASDYDCIFCGDLLNQCIASNFGLESFDIPFLGLYGACSTMASALLCASVFTESGAVGRCVAAASSHFASSERQFRTPLLYGGQRAPTAQRTVTGAGAVTLERSGCIRITAATIGAELDMGITDPNNMGAAMAPVSVKLTP